MDELRSCEQWLNPLFTKSDTDASTCSAKKERLSKATEVPKDEPDEKMKRLFQCVSKSWKSIKNLPSVSSFASSSKCQKDVVMEGYIPSTKRSLIDFLKGMGLKPKVEVIGKETTVTADVSVLRDVTLKNRFVSFMRKQTVAVVTEDLTSSTSTRTSRISSSSSKTSDRVSDPSVLSKKPDKSRLESCLKREKVWYPSEKTEENYMDNKERKLEDFEEKKERKVGFKMVAMAPRVRHDDNPFARQIPIRTHIVIDSDEDQVFDTQGERKSVYCSTGGTPALGSTVYQIPNSPIPRHPTRHDKQVMTEESVLTSERLRKKKKLRVMKHLRKWFARHNTSSVRNRCAEVATDCKDLGGCQEIHEGSREFYSYNPLLQYQAVSDSPDPDVIPVVTKLCTEYEGRCQSYQPAKDYKNPLSFKTLKKEQRGVSKTSNRLGRIKKSRMNSLPFDGSVSMPMLNTPEFSCTNHQRQDLVESSKSSARVTENNKAQASFSVVGNSAAIHIAKKRIRLEGKDAKYGSILHEDKDFDMPFRVLKESSFTDIEKQVKKVKERIMFARAMGAIGDRLPESVPKVNYKELLMPAKHNQESRKRDQNYVDVATTSSFYQKFLASMNLLKTTHRTDACDRSVMTDEPLSRTYADFINILREQSTVSKPSEVSHSSSEEDHPNEDSSADLPATSYLKILCTCWEPLIRFFPDSSDVGQSQRYTNKLLENSRTEEEKILKCIVDKVLNCSRNHTSNVK